MNSSSAIAETLVKSGGHLKFPSLDCETCLYCEEAFMLRGRGALTWGWGVLRGAAAYTYQLLCYQCPGVILVDGTLSHKSLMTFLVLGRFGTFVGGARGAWTKVRS